MRLCVSVLWVAIVSICHIVPLASAEELREVEIQYNQGRREITRTVFCRGQAPGNARVQRNGQVRFIPIVRRVRNLTAQLQRDPRNSRLQNRLRNQRLLLRAARRGCRETRGPSGGGDGGAYFDNFTGDLTENGRRVFGIPTGLSANVLVGQQIWSRNCIGCHEERRMPTFDELRRAISIPPMGFTTEFLSDADLAQIMTFVSRFRSPGNE